MNDEINEDSIKDVKALSCDLRNLIYEKVKNKENQPFIIINALLEALSHSILCINDEEDIDTIIDLAIDVINDCKNKEVRDEYKRIKDLMGNE